MANCRASRYWFLMGYGVAASAVVLAVGIRELLAPVLGETLPRVTFYPAIMVAAYLGGFGPGLLSALASALIIDYFFTKPYGQLSLFTDRIEGVESLVYLITTAVLAILATAFARVSRRARDEAVALRASEQALRAASEDLRLLKQAAEEANRAKDQFLATLSHELRTPLTPVLMSASAMEKDEALPLQVREDIGLIRRNVELQTKLIDDLLDLTRIARGKLELKLVPVDAKILVRQTIEMCDADARAKGLSMETEIAGASCLVQADPTRLRQVIWNLVRNSVKFTPAGGRIMVRCFSGQGRRLVIEVADTGIGIAPEVLPRVFDAFEQGDRGITRQFGGLGLGLAICKALVEKHGGTITASSQGRSRGATFRVELPLHQAEETSFQGDQPGTGNRGGESEPARLPDASGADSLQSLNILLVEDHKETARMMSRLLQAEGYSVQTAMDVASALELADIQEFQLVISDIGLPDSSGLELMRKLLSRHSIKGIALSEFGMDEDIRKSREAGFSEHLTKPINFDDLRATIARVVPDRRAASVQLVSVEHR